MSFRQRSDRSQHVFSHAKIRQFPLNASRFSRDQDIRPSSRSAVNKPLQTSSRIAPASAPALPASRPVTIRPNTRRRLTPSPSPPPVTRERKAFHMYEDPPAIDLSVDPFGDEDEDWRRLEYTSSGEHSSEESDQDDHFFTDSDSDDSPWEGPNVYFPPRPPKIPHAPKRLPLFPVATKSRKRASLKEAHRRRFGALFPLDQDSVEEKNALKPDGKLGNYLHLVTCVPDRKIPPKAKRRKPKVVVSADSESKCSCSVESTDSTLTVVDSLFSPSSSRSLSTAATSCPSCSASLIKGETEKPTKALNIPIIILTPPSRYPPPLPSTPIPACSCPLVQHILDIDLAESQAAAKAESDRLAAEEAAFQASLVKAREFIDRRSARSRCRTNSAVYGAKWLIVGQMSHFAYQDSISAVPSSSLHVRPVENSAEATRSKPHIASHPITTAYGYRARSSQVKAVFGSDRSNPNLDRIPRSCVEFATFDVPRRRSSSQSFPKYQHRSPSPLPRSWLDDPSIPVGDAVISDRGEPSSSYRHRSTKWMIPAPPPVSQSQTLRRRNLVDPRFFRVYALENSVRIRAAQLGLGEADWVGSRSMNMCRPARSYCLVQRRKSPLAC